LVGALGVRARARWAWVVLELGPCARSASSSSWAFFFPSFPFLSFTPLPRATRAAAGRLCDVGGESPSAARRSRVHCMWGQQERFPVSFLFLRREGAQPRPSSFCQHGTREHNNTCSRMGHGPRAATTPQKFRRVSSSGSFDLSSANDTVLKKNKR
jgi:hypothetical protein